MGIRIKDWGRFQHFKDRRPPWIKLYRDILEDPDWHELDPLASKVLTMLWLVASEDPDQNGQLPDVRRLSFRLRIEEVQLRQALTKLSHWLIFDDDTVISQRYQSVIPETETETETEGEAKPNRKRFCPPTVTEVSEYAKEKNLNIDPNRFVDFYESKGWIVGKAKMKDWKAAARGWSNREKNNKQPETREIAL